MESVMRRYRAQIRPDPALRPWQARGLWLLTADLETGQLSDAAPNWLVVDCHDRGLVTPGDRPGAWKLSQDGWDARTALLAG